MHKRQCWDIKGGAAALQASESRVATCKLGEERQLGFFAPKNSFLTFFVVFLQSRSPPKVSADFFSSLLWVVTCFWPQAVEVASRSGRSPPPLQVEVQCADGGRPPIKDPKSTEKEEEKEEEEVCRLVLFDCSFI